MAPPVGGRLPEDRPRSLMLFFDPHSKLLARNVGLGWRRPPALGGFGRFAAAPTGARITAGWGHLVRIDLHSSKLPVWWRGADRTIRPWICMSFILAVVSLSLPRTTTDCAYVADDGAVAEIGSVRMDFAVQLAVEGQFRPENLMLPFHLNVRVRTFFAGFVCIVFSFQLKP